MKKLMIGMLAAGAAIASAWAQNDAESTFSSETFDSKDAGAFTDIAAPWEYSADSVGDGELTITTGGHTDDGKFLGLNTASKKLSLAPNADGTAYEVASEVYFDSYVKFDAASDTIPEVSGTDKLALFVLDNTDYVESDPSTALYVLGGYWNGTAIEKRLYRLNASVSDLTGFKRVSIKMYSNVMKEGVPVPGFVVMIDNVIAAVNGVFAIEEDGSVNFGSDAMEYGSYLGATIKPDIAASRYNTDDAQLILGLAMNATTTLNAVDFMGKGGIDDLAFGTTDVGFGEDAQLFTVDIPANKVTGVYADAQSNTVYKAGDEIVVPEGGLTLYVQLADGYYWNGQSGLVSVTVNTDDTLAGKLSGAFEAILLADGVAYGSVGTEEGQGQFNPATSVETIKLLKTVDLDNLRLQVTAICELDLNGCEIKSTADQTIFATTGLTIIDNAANGGGKVTGSVVGNVTINAGTFDGAVTGSGIKIPVTSTAKFLATANTAATLEGMLTEKQDSFTYSFADGDWDGDGNLDGYLMIVATAVSNNDVTVKGEIATGDQATADANVAEIEAELDANGATEDAKAWVEKIYGVEGVPAADLVGAQNIDISVKFDLPLMRNTPVITVEASTVEAPAEGQPENVAAFEFTITDGVDGAELTPASVEKILGMVQYVESLTGDWAEATDADVATKISGTKIKVQLKKKADKNCGFMKLKLR